MKQKLRRSEAVESRYRHSPRTPALPPSRSRSWSRRLWLHISHPPLSSAGIWSRSVWLSLQPDLHSNLRSAHCRRKGRRSFSAWRTELPEGRRGDTKQRSAPQLWITMGEATSQAAVSGLGDRSLSEQETLLVNRAHPCRQTQVAGPETS